MTGGRDSQKPSHRCHPSASSYSKPLARKQEWKKDNMGITPLVLATPLATITPLLNLIQMIWIEIAESLSVKQRAQCA